MKLFRKIILEIFKPFLKILSHVKFPGFIVKYLWSSGITRGEFLKYIKPFLKPGYGVFTTKYGEFTNMMNPSDPKHGLLFLRNLLLMEAVNKGVDYTSALKSIVGRHEVVVVEPLFANKTERQQVCDYAEEKFIGMDYDYESEDGDNEKYCIEVYVDAYQDKMPRLRLKSRDLMGGKTYLAQDVIGDTRHFRVVLRIRKTKKGLIITHK